MADRWAIYDPDADEMITTTYPSYQAACIDAGDLDGVLVVYLGDVAPDKEESDGDSSEGDTGGPG